MGHYCNPNFTCPICGTEFYCAPSRLKSSKSTPYCSKECSTILREQLKDLNCTCSFCGKKFHKKPSHITNYNYCSRECLAEHRKIILRGKNNPNAFCRIPEGNKRLHCGYYWIFMPNHPFAAYNGYIREHRLIAEQFLLTEENRVEINGKYYLSPKYDVHHKNGNKLDNRPENLEILTRSEHVKVHSKQKK